MDTITKFRPVHLRELTPDEFEKIRRFSFENFLEESAKAINVSTASIRDKLGSPPGPPDCRNLWRAVEVEGQYAGFFWIRLSADKSTAFGFDIYLDAHFRGRGIGRQVMIEGRNLLRSMAVKTLSICVYGNNTVARKLYDSLGFYEKEYWPKRNQYCLGVEI